MAYKLDSNNTLNKHRCLIQSKSLLRKIYTNYYNEFKKVKVPVGPRVELGSGAGFIKEIIPETITSDVVSGNRIDKVFSAEKMPFRNNSVAVFYMFNVLHHIKNPEKALMEMQRSLKPKGKIVMIEPYNSKWGRFIYQNFHHETFDPSKKTWIIEGVGRLSDANGAIPWIIFVRDRNIFEKKFPRLNITIIKPHTPFLYLLSGGLSKYQLIPHLLENTFIKIERLFSPFNKHLGMFVTIVLKKVK